MTFIFIGRIFLVVEMQKYVNIFPDLILENKNTVYLKKNTEEYDVKIYVWFICFYVL